MKITLKGIIVPFTWDDQHNITSLALSTAGEREYQIEMNGIGKSLMKHISSQVQLEGEIKKSETSNGIISVNYYEIIAWGQSDEEFFNAASPNTLQG